MDSPGPTIARLIERAYLAAVQTSVQLRGADQGEQIAGAALPTHRVTSCYQVLPASSWA